MNGLSSLDVGNNAELTYLNCYGNMIKNLDVSKNSKLTTCEYDQNAGITVTGWPRTEDSTPDTPTTPDESDITVEKNIDNVTALQKLIME